MKAVQALAAHGIRCTAAALPTLPTLPKRWALLALLAATALDAAAADTAKPGDTFRDCADCPEMVVVPAGKARLGSTAADRARFPIPKLFADREALQLDVTIARPFAVSKFEVTRALYQRYAAETALKTEPGCYGFDIKTGTWPLDPALSWRNPGFAQRDDEPVLCMNYPDAKAYVDWLAKKTGKPYRLLSETEWEYAARGGASTTYPWGDGFDVICQMANVYDTPTAAALGDREGVADKVCDRPHVKPFVEPVGSYPPNGFGLHDMVGNVWEMTADCASDTYANVPADGSVADSPGCSRRMPRGGGWNSRAWTARLAIRGQGDAAYRGVALGIRVGRDLP